MKNAKLSRVHLQAIVEVFGPDEGAQFTQQTWARIRQTIMTLLEDTQQAEDPRIERYAVEINHLRNVIQAACNDGLDGMIRRWAELFPDAPVPTVRLVPQIRGADDFDALVSRMADRLMGWPLPKDFNPDGRVGFDRIGLDALGYPRGWPTGTNLLTHEQAKAMFEYVLGTNPSAHASPPPNCRQRLKAEGKPYPRSSCESCGQLSPMWKTCDAAITLEGGSK